MDYLDWQSSLSLDDVFNSQNQFSYPSLLPDGSIIFLGLSNDEKPRSVLWRLDGKSLKCLTPEPYSLQTLVNEYGGKPYWLDGFDLVFANKDDQCLYRQSLATKADPVLLVASQDTAMDMYTDVSRFGANFLCIVERENPVDHSANEMFIGCINTETQEVLKCQSGADFYSNLVLSPNGKRAAWLEWDHPNMPWDLTRMYVADIESRSGSVSFSNIVEVDLSTIHHGNVSHCQLLFSDSDTLVFSADFQSAEGDPDYWNMYSYHCLETSVSQLTHGENEYGYPHWQYGDGRIVRSAPNQLVAIASSPESDRLVSIDVRSKQVEEQYQSTGKIQYLHTDQNGQMVCMELGAATAPALLLFKTGEGGKLDVANTVKGGEKPDFDPSLPEHISYPSSADAVAHGFYYPPRNPKYEVLTDKSHKPPLLVMVHGGPTSRAYSYLDLQKQFWTSRGFAILDVNHRGSSGYGRAYRDALYAKWGETDIDDIVAGIKHLVIQGLVDPERICIRGKSAGGYAVLRALTEHASVFRAGACYYGIANLVTLAETTHKFEKHYVDRLIGEDFDIKRSIEVGSRYRERSPINHLHQLDSAMIIFQGALDKVVPPSVAHELVAALRSQKLSHEYIEFEDEAHGFKNPINNRTAWQRELAFYKTAFTKTNH